MQTDIRQNLKDLQTRIQRARARGAHASDDVRMIVVTKAAPPSVLPLLADLGVRDIGENRVQAASARRPDAPKDLVWHGIGHLQRNKAARAVELFDVFHALDSERLANRLESVLASIGKRWPVYIEVNAADDPAKGGVRPEETLAFVKTVLSHPHLHLEGFMTMARLEADEAAARQTFRTMREVRDQALQSGLGEPPPGRLSMGMTDDFEWAVEEGATDVRIGRAVFRSPDDPESESAASTAEERL